MPGLFYAHGHGKRQKGGLVFMLLRGAFAGTMRDRDKSYSHLMR